MALATLVPPGVVVADIGTDHAYLPIYLVQSGQVMRAVAADISPGSLESARQAVTAAGLEERISLRLGSGLSVLTPGEAEIVVIAGLGSTTIADIVALEPEVATSAQAFLLQPMTKPGDLRRRLTSLGLTLKDEKLVLDKGRFYVTMVATPGTMPAFPEELLEIGPYLAAHPDPMLPAYLTYRIEQEKKVRAKTCFAKSAAARARSELASHRINAWREMLYVCQWKLRS
ncbi:MAG TPA: SAM-dependent methyltransferase [Firmicutes bacterium]|nr:SAM-dependent methyltransferase [Bacillota bacterium]